MSNALINNKIKIKSVSKISEVGFTLVEMAIVITIGGILLAFMGSALTAYMKKSRITTTEFRIEKIQEAMEQYLSVNREYPCASDRTLGSDNSAFGKQITACSGPGTTVSSGVHIGAVPTRTLNLPDEFIADAWGQKFTFAVTIDLADPTLYAADGGVINIVDTSGPIYNEAHYVIVSHGQTGAGGYILGTGVTPPTPCPTAPSVERENCDNNATFRTTLLISEASPATFFDDYLYYKGQTEPVLLIPQSAVMAFNLDNCPDGWSPYDNAIGHFIIGFDHTSVATPVTLDVPTQQISISPGALGSPGDGLGAQVPPGTRTFPLAPTVATVTIDADLGSAQPSASGGIPSYVALLYCEKD